MMMCSPRTPALAVRRLSPLVLLFACVTAGLAGTGCVTVRPEQRAVLADPTMRFEGEPGEKAALEHVLENREASFGGGSVRGGGCGCN
jgi:hypothetical protein